MACDPGFEEWTFETINDRTMEKIIILFCFKFDQGNISGFVFDKDGLPLSDDNRVAGMRVPTLEPMRDFMGIEFRWDKPMEAIRIFMIGFIFLDPNDDTMKFDGRFIAVRGPADSVVTARSLRVSPDVGDTGTGNGTQT